MRWTSRSSIYTKPFADPGGGGGGSGHRPLPAPWNFGKDVVIGFVNGVGLILHSIYVEYNPDYMCALCRLELISVLSLILILECPQGNNEKLERM